MTGADLKAFRKSLNKTQQQMMEYLGLKRRGTISDYERGILEIPGWLKARIEAEKKGLKDG